MRFTVGIKLKGKTDHLVVDGEAGGHLTAPDADARMAEGPDHQVSGICAEALAALLKGIRDLAREEEAHV